LAVRRGFVSQHRRGEPAMMVPSTSMTSSCAWMRTRL